MFRASGIIIRHFLGIECPTFPTMTLVSPSVVLVPEIGDGEERITAYSNFG
jgi:hypothetical protein